MAETSNSFFNGMISGVLLALLAAICQWYLLMDQIRAQKKMLELQLLKNRENLELQIKSNEKILRQQLLFSDQKNALLQLSIVLEKYENEPFYRKKDILLKFLKSENGLYLTKDIEANIMKAIHDAESEIQETWEEEFGTEPEPDYDDYSEQMAQEWEDADPAERVNIVVSQNTHVMTNKIKSMIEQYFKI